MNFARPARDSIGNSLPFALVIGCQGRFRAGRSTESGLAYLP